MCRKDVCSSAIYCAFLDAGNADRLVGSSDAKSITFHKRINDDMNKLKLPLFESPAKPGSPEAVLVFGGDFCPVNGYEKKIISGEIIFDNALAETFQSNDFAMINLEAPLCAKGLPADSLNGSGLRGDPQVAEFLRNTGIDAVSLANNHIRDFRDEGVFQTMRNLDKHGILHTGAGKDLRDAQRPLSVDVNGIKVGIWALAEKELNAATDSSAGSSWFRPEHDVHRIAELKEEFDFLVVYLHAGHEFISTPSPRIRESCRNLIEAGADAVIAHHPHVIQGVEKYKQGLIAYSLGNLVFDTPYVSAHKNTDLGYLIRIGISKHQIREAEIIPYKLRDTVSVSTLNSSEFEEFSAKFHELSENITDDLKFQLEWENNVRFRWGNEYKRILNDLSKNFNDPENKDYARRTKNLFTCPTHVEMLEKALSMIEEGKIPR